MPELPEMYRRYSILRDELGYHDADVARITSITPSTFSDWKNNKSFPNTQKMVSIANALGTTVEYLVTGEVGHIGRLRASDNLRRHRAVYLTKEQENLLYLWDQITPEQRENVNALLNSFIMQKNASSDSQQSEGVS